jgi:hypothetical protein
MAAVVVEDLTDTPIMHDVDDDDYNNNDLSCVIFFGKGKDRSMLRA